MRAANLFLFLGTVGFINIYEELTGEDEATGKLDASDAKRLQRKFGVKEKRAAGPAETAAAAAAAAGDAPAAAIGSLNLEDFNEELLEHLKRPVRRGLANCEAADGAACNCLRLVCFGQAECTRQSVAAAAVAANASAAPVQPGDARYVYYATGVRQRARHATEGQQHRLVRCRQTTIDPYVLCECKMYTRNRRDA